MKQLSTHKFFTDQERKLIADTFSCVDDTIVNSGFYFGKWQKIF